MPVRVRLWARALRGLKKTLVRALLLIGILWATLLVGIYLLLSTETGHNIIRQQVVRSISEALDTEVEIQSLRLSGIASISIEGFVLYDKACQPFIRAPELRITWYPFAFWQGLWVGRKRIPFSAIELIRPQVYIYTERASKLTNVNRLFATSDTTPSKPSEWKVSLPSVELHNGQFIWIDSTLPALELTPRPGFLRYGHLRMDSIFLEAKVEWSGKGILFTHIKSLQLIESNSGMPLHQLSLTLQAYPDSVRIPHLFIQLPKSKITGKGYFPYEGLDKLFKSTETKLFYAELTGQVDWSEIAALVGNSLPLRGVWETHIHLHGDLYRFHADSFYARISSQTFLRGSGEITRYAKPNLMRWNVFTMEAEFTWNDLAASIPEIGPPLPDWQGSHVWKIRGSHEGRLDYYTADVYSLGAHIQGALRRDTAWNYDLHAEFNHWQLPPILETPITTIANGTIHLQGTGFSLENLQSELRSDLTLLDTAGKAWAVQIQADLREGTADGKFSLHTPYGKLNYAGQLPLSVSGTYQGSGTFADISGSLWGGKGTLSGNFKVEGKDIPWKNGAAQLYLKDLLWQQIDTTYELGAGSLSVRNGNAYDLQAEGLSLSAKTNGAWLKALSQWLSYWILNDTIHLDSLPSSWAIQGNFHLRNPAWIAVFGLPPELRLHNLSVSIAIQAEATFPAGELQATIDSLRYADLIFHSPHLSAHLRGDSLNVQFGSIHGKAYLEYKSLHGSLTGTWRKGSLTIGTHFHEWNDSARLALEWDYSPPMLSVQLNKEASALMLGGYPWQFIEAFPLLFNTENGEWELKSLRLEGLQAQVNLYRLERRLFLNISRFPLSVGGELLGLKASIGGDLSLLWEAYERGARFALEIDSLQYEQQQYPHIQVVGVPSNDSIPFQLFIRDENSTWMTGQGIYKLNDTVSPIYAELRSIRIPVRWFDPFIGEYIQNIKGTLLSQRLILQGKPNSPNIYGELFCNNVSFYLPITRVSYTVEGVLRLRKDTIFFPNVELREAQGKRSYINGTINLRSWQSPYLELTLRLKDRPFLMAASSATTDAYLYGRAELENGYLSITGPWNKPFLRGEITFSGSTELTLPLRTYERNIGAEHVRFVASKDTTDTTLIPPSPTAPSGLDIRVAIRSVPEAKFRLLFDERTGDEIIARGASNLLFSIDRMGQISLSGAYEIQDGEYRINLQGIVSKRLQLEPGSRISWDGDLYQGQMNITATYRTFSSLRMIDTTFTQTIPVELRVILRGSLLSPVMNFQIDIPSLSGTPTPMVNLFLQRLATDEQERNRQVFALLVLGTFVPLEQGFGSQQVRSGVSSTLAEFISAQLASWVGQMLGSQVGVAFALGEWNELSAQLRISLGQRLTIERDGVLISPGQSAANIGNLSARYRLIPKRVTQPTQWQLEAEGFSRQSFMWGAAGATSQGAGLRLRKSFYLPPRRQNRIGQEEKRK
ncbi:MAG: translocation/assembly module TamB domain-containing protein [Bacteroidia bacterium]